MQVFRLSFSFMERLIFPAESHRQANPTQGRKSRPVARATGLLLRPCVAY